MQAVVTEMVEKVRFSPAPGVEIRRAHAGVMQPFVRGQDKKGNQLPLTVSLIELD